MYDAFCETASKSTSPTSLYRPHLGRSSRALPTIRLGLELGELSELESALLALALLELVLPAQVL